MHTLDIRLKPSKLLIALFLVMMFSTIAIIAIIPCMLWIKMVLVFLSIFSISRILYVHGFLISRHSIMLLQQLDQEWKLGMKNHTITAKVCGHSTLTSLVCIIRFKEQHKHFKRTCILFKDSITDDDYRRLLVQLHCYRS